jgi:hypothetical protein
MTKHESNAINYYLCDHPYKATFEEILKLVESESDDVVIWQPFENYSGEEVAELIQEMADNLKYSYESED